MRAAKYATLLAAVALMGGCATPPKRLAACAGAPGKLGLWTQTDRQNVALGHAVEARFGKRPQGYHMLVRQPRPSSVDPRGNLVFDVYDIYPALADPAGPLDRRRLIVALHPCTLEVMKADAPRA